MNRETIILEALEEVRPYLLADGGDIEFIELNDNKVYVRLLGTCSECNLKSSTLKLGVEQIIKNHLPEISEVINITKD